MQTISALSYSGLLIFDVTIYLVLFLVLCTVKMHRFLYLYKLVFVYFCMSVLC